MGETRVIVCDICNLQVNPATPGLMIEHFNTGQQTWVLTNNCKNDPNIATMRTTAKTAMRAELNTTFDQIAARLAA